MIRSVDRIIFFEEELENRKFIDIHNHIIFEFDDGPSSFAEVKKMLEVAKQQNTGHIFATSHFQEYANKELLDDYYKKIDTIIEYSQQNKLNIKIYPGAEILQHEKMEESVFLYKNYRLKETSNYVLFEYPMFQVANNYLDSIFKLRLKKIRPIIAHPERYQIVYKNFNVLLKMLNLGALIQINCGSILGNFGKPIQEITKKMLKLQLVHFVASDAHRAEGRTFKLQDAYEYCSSFLTPEYLNKIFFENPQDILDNKDIEPVVPEIEEHRNTLKDKILKVLKFK